MSDHGKLDASERVHSFLVHRHAELLRRLGPERVPPLRIDPPIAEEEARDFVAGLEASLFDIDDEGYAQSELLPRHGQRQQRTWQLFWTMGRNKTRTLFREGICQLAAASALVLQHGFPREQVHLEPDIPGHRWAVDVVVCDSTQSRARILGEVKRRERDLEELLEAMNACLGREAHGRLECLARKHHPKAAVCRSTKASYFWAVCPGRRDAFRIEPTSSSVRLSKIETLPSAEYGTV